MAQLRIDYCDAGPFGSAQVKMLYCIALCNTGVLMPYQCLYDFSYIIALLYVYLVCVCWWLGAG